MTANRTRLDASKPLAITGASSARAAHIIKEAFYLFPKEKKTPRLKLLFIGESEYEEELQRIVQDRDGVFYFLEYDP